MESALNNNFTTNSRLFSRKVQPEIVFRSADPGSYVNTLALQAGSIRLTRPVSTVLRLSESTIQ